MFECTTKDCVKPGRSVKSQWREAKCLHTERGYSSLLVSKMPLDGSMIVSDCFESNPGANIWCSLHHHTYRSGPACRFSNDVMTALHSDHNISDKLSTNEKKI